MKLWIGLVLVCATSGCGGGSAEAGSGSNQGPGGTGTGGAASPGGGDDDDGGGDEDASSDVSTGGSNSDGGIPGVGGSAGAPIDGSIPDTNITFPDAVETDNWCAPDAEFYLDLTACCNDTPCKGLCYQGDAGIECRCFNLLGGCQEGTICCDRYYACTTVATCDGTF